jgi:DNA-directed RNA polymerase subunit beta'
MYINQKFIDKFNSECILLEIKLPRDIFKSPFATEVALASLLQGGGVNKWYSRNFQGNLPVYSSLEIASLEGVLHFYIRIHKKFRPLVEANFYAQYPGIEIVEADDYTKKIRYHHLTKDVSTWSSSYRLIKKWTPRSKDKGEPLKDKEGKEKSIKVLSDSKADGKPNEIEYNVVFQRTPLVKVGDRVKAGELLTDGSADISEVYKYGNIETVEQYIIREINKVYELQSASIAKKHTEIIVRQMFSRRRIKDAGDTTFSLGDVVENTALIEENQKVAQLGLKEAKGEIVVLGITEVSLRTKSWLSAASFQNTNRVLIENAMKGGIDHLRGLKENVIVGRLIPAGTGFKQRTDSSEE